MKRLLYLFLAVATIVACGESKPQKAAKPQAAASSENLPADSTLYGICGSGTKGRQLVLVTSLEDTLQILINDDETDNPTIVAGGLMAGDRIAVTAYRVKENLVAQRVINLTSLLGKWEGLDKSFELTEAGEVNTLRPSSKRWTQWRILNGQLVLSRDTFDFVSLNVDSMLIEDRIGLYSYYRIRKDTTHASDEDRKREAAEKARRDSIEKARQQAAAE